jgi:hypothetical protein
VFGSDQKQIYLLVICGNVNVTIYRILLALKVEIDIITNIVSSLIERVVILVIKYVEIFKTDIIVFIGKVMRHHTDPYKSQFFYTDNFTRWDQEKISILPIIMDNILGGRCGDRMVVRFITTYVSSVYHH